VEIYMEAESDMRIRASALLTQIEMLLARISMAFLAGRNMF
jgi:hypothetical protein